MIVQYTNVPDKAQPVSSALPSQNVASRPTNTYRNIGKRVLDTAFVLMALPIALPIMLIMALLVAKDGHNPFYGQTRVGRGGRKFTMWKLRTMVPNAQARLEGYLASNKLARLEWDEHQKLKNDPRITPVGHILRKTSLDELPQLFNVLTGDMSLVGPRPMMPDQQKLYPGRAYYDLRPGITGSWQVSERNGCSFAGRADFDTSYSRNVSLKTDMGILCATVGVVLGGTGY